MKKLLFVILISSLLFASCSKKDKPVINYPITGLWIGTYTLDDDSQPPLYYAFNSTIIIQGQGGDGVTYYQYGTWSLSGASFSASTITTEGFNGSNNGVKETETATFDTKKGKLTFGIWQTIYHTGKFL